MGSCGYNRKREQEGYGIKRTRKDNNGGIKCYGDRKLSPRLFRPLEPKPQRQVRHHRLKELMKRSMQRNPNNGRSGAAGGKRVSGELSCRPQKKKGVPVFVVWRPLMVGFRRVQSEEIQRALAGELWFSGRGLYGPGGRQSTEKKSAERGTAQRERDMEQNDGRTHYCSWNLS